MGEPSLARRPCCRRAGDDRDLPSRRASRGTGHRSRRGHHRQRRQEHDLGDGAPSSARRLPIDGARGQSRGIAARLVGDRRSRLGRRPRALERDAVVALGAVDSGGDVAVLRGRLVAAHRGPDESRREPHRLARRLPSLQRMQAADPCGSVRRPRRSLRHPIPHRVAQGRGGGGRRVSGLVVDGRRDRRAARLRPGVDPCLPARRPQRAERRARAPHRAAGMLALERRCNRSVLPGVACVLHRAPASTRARCRAAGSEVLQRLEVDDSGGDPARRARVR